MYSIFFLHPFFPAWLKNDAVSKQSSLTSLQVLQSVIEPQPFLCGVEVEGTAMGSCCAQEAPELTVLSETHLPLPLPPNSQSLLCVCVCVPTHCREKQQQELMCSRLKVGPKESHMRALGEGRSTMSQSTNCCLNSLPQVYGLICMRDFKLKLKLKAYTKQSFMKICRFKSMVKECVLRVFSSKDQTKMCSFWNAMQYILLDARIIRCD